MLSYYHGAVVCRGDTNVAIFVLTSMLLASAVQSPWPKTVHITYHIAAMLRGTSECTTEYNRGGDAACTNGTPVPRTMTCHYVKQWQCIAVKAGQFRIKIYATESVLLKILPWLMPPWMNSVTCNYITDCTYKKKYYMCGDICTHGSPCLCKKPLPIITHSLDIHKQGLQPPLSLSAYRLIIVSTVLSSWLDCPGWVVTNKQCMPHSTSLLICPSLIAQWLEHLPR